MFDTVNLACRAFLTFCHAEMKQGQAEAGGAEAWVLATRVGEPFCPPHLLGTPGESLY